ncbi:MAG: glycoside hydrolase family 20 zincin-like fold domain-containing protein [Anaerolineae bacterium]|jgi:hypothetical protein
MPLHLLPQPKELMFVKGMFTFDRDTLLVIHAKASDPAFIAAQQLRSEVEQATGLRLTILKAFSPPRVTNLVLLAHGPDQARAFELDADKPAIPGAPSNQAYRLQIQRGRAALYAKTEVGLFYAVQTLRQLVRLQGRALPTLTIRDWPTLIKRGLLLDISRRKVPTLDTLKQLVDELSHFKLNVLQLYTEHTFQFLHHPKIGTGCGSLSSEDVMELDLHCRQHHIELMPNLQSLGHSRNTLRLPDYKALAETELLWTVSPAHEETYRLLGELYADMLPSFSSPILNVNCDEAYDLGQGASRDLARQVGVGQVYLRHILRLRQLAARYGRRIQIWGDFLLTHPHLLNGLPDDVTLLDWHYDPAEDYPSVQVFAQAGRRFWVCPGVGSWNSLYPRLHGARTNIRNLTQQGARAGAEGVLTTDWGDFGHYQYLGLSWPGYAFGAEQGWTGGQTSEADFDGAWGPLFLGQEHDTILEAMELLASTNDLPGVPMPNRSRTVLALFDEPLTGETVTGEDALSGKTLNSMLALSESALDILQPLLVEPQQPRGKMIQEMISVAQLTAYAARKTQLGQQIRTGLHSLKHHHKEARDRIPEGAQQISGYMQALKGLQVELEKHQAEFERLWLARSRRSEIHVALGYFTGLSSRYQAAIAWLEEQRQKILAGQAIDAELETYSVASYRVLWQTWPD